MTHDKDFGELVIRIGVPAECGVILLRLSGNNRNLGDQPVVQAKGIRSEWEGHFSAITDERMGMCRRPSPSSPPVTC